MLPRRPTSKPLSAIASVLTTALALAALSFIAPAPASAQPGADDPVLQARDALKRRDRAALAAARSVALAARHPLAPWVDYWELSNRLPEAQQGELDAFYARWPGSYVEDRLRNDWLLELGRRRDWAGIRAEYPRFRMNDDREVSCYALAAAAADGQDVRGAARAAILAQRESEDGCGLLARTLASSRLLTAGELWHAARWAVENNRPRIARALALLADPGQERAVATALDEPLRHLVRGRLAPNAAGSDEVTLLALIRLATSDPESAAAQIDAQTGLPRALQATAWAHAARQAAVKQLPQAADWARRAWQLWDGGHPARDAAAIAPPWSDELLAWHVRAALRQGDAADGRLRWGLVVRAVDAMTPAEQRDPAWVYWKARAIRALARPGADGDASRAASQAAFASIAQQPSYYGQLAAEELGQVFTTPPAPLPPTAAEREATRAQPGLARALQLVSAGLRNEGVREWNFTLRGMGERDLFAAAQWACERQVWDRCINTSDRTRIEFDASQRYPTPFRDQVIAKARSTGLDPALLYGLIRQESRFITDARSGVGAAGLMQLMPETARLTARKVGIAWRPEMIGDPDVNLTLGAAYLRQMVDDFGGSLAMATAAYNAGPGRPRRWREGPVVEPAAWVESIVFGETRDYVKKVLHNSIHYAAVLGQPVPTLRSRLGPSVGPRDSAGGAAAAAAAATAAAAAAATAGATANPLPDRASP